jgi:hypothetical protein
MGRLEEALGLRHEVLDANRRHLGDDHPYTLKAEEWLGIDLRATGNLEDAKCHFSHVVGVRMRTQGPNDKQTVQANRWLDTIEPEISGMGR